MFISSSSKYVIVNNNNSLFIPNISNGDVIQYYVFETNISSICFDRSSRHIAIGFWNGTVIYIDIKKGFLWRKRLDNRILHIKMDENGSLIFLASNTNIYLFKYSGELIYVKNFSRTLYHLSISSRDRKMRE